MALPDPQPGLVIRYAYLWHHEYRGGHEEGSKDRPCVIVRNKALAGKDFDHPLVTLVPVTHRRPDDPALALEVPASVKRHLNLDDARSWLVLDEVNEFVWPGFDLRPLPGGAGCFAYGFLPPRLFGQMILRLSGIWTNRQGKRARRD